MVASRRALWEMPGSGFAYGFGSAMAADTGAKPCQHRCAMGPMKTEARHRCTQANLLTTTTSSNHVNGARLESYSTTHRGGQGWSQTADLSSAGRRYIWTMVRAERHAPTARPRAHH